MTTSSLPTPGAIGKSATTYAKDLAERVGSTFLQAFLAGVTVTTPFDLSMWKAAALGGVAAGYALIKGLVAKVRGDKNSASLTSGA